MKFIELTIHTTSEASELVSDAVWDYSEGGVAVSDVNDIIALQRDTTVFWDYMDDSVKNPERTDVLVKCYLNPATAEKAEKEIREELSRRAACGAVPFGTLETTKREIEGDDWIDVWRNHFRPIHLNRIVVVPEWIPYEKGENEEIVLIDSNMAFGTGEHETTSMCVTLMQDYLKAGDVCIDVGCGSGILGISALKLGAKQCYLSDLDPIAVESSLHNAQKNGVLDRAVITQSNLLDGTGIACDLMFANITAEVLLLLAPSIPKNLKTGGYLILSGIIAERLSAVKEAYGEWKLVREERKGEWYALVYRKEA